MTNEKLYKALQEVRHGARTLDNLIAEVHATICTENARKAGTANLRAAMLSVLKNAAKHPKEALHYARTVGGVQWVCDSYQLIRTTTPQELPELPPALDPVDFGRILCSYPAGEMVELPTIAELKQTKAERAAQIKAKTLAPNQAKAYDLYTSAGTLTAYAVSIDYLQNAIKAGCTRCRAAGCAFILSDDAETVTYLILGIKRGLK